MLMSREKGMENEEFRSQESEWKELRGARGKPTGQAQRARIEQII